jgi:Ca2+-binding EF-hand superfamily protein
MKPNLSSSTTLGFAVALVCAACFTSTVAAQGADSARQEKMRADLQKRFTAADTNADGRLSRDEAKAGMPRIYNNFDAIDTEKTGSVSLEQIAAFAEKQGGRR